MSAQTLSVSPGSANTGAASAFKASIPGLLALALVVAVLSGARLPVISTDRDAFLAMLGLGWLGCMVSAGSTVQALGWRHPISLLGVALGVVALILVALVFTGTTAPLASLAQAFAGPASRASAERVQFVGLGAVIVAKSALGLVGSLFGGASGCSAYSAETSR